MSRREVADPPGVPRPGGPRGPGARIVPIREALDLFRARSETRALAEAAGFDRVVCEELAIVVTELCTNMLKYAGGGDLEVGPGAGDGGRQGLAIRAIDRGPPIDDFELAVQDGFCATGPLDPGEILSRGGLGAGLGAVARLTDELSYEEEEGQKFVLAKRFL